MSGKLQCMFSEDLKNKNNVLFDSTFKKQKFCHYTSIDAINGILSDEGFHISNYKKCNDTHEVIYQEKNENIFILSFCSSKSEKIPMWYLYSGIGGTGGRIRLTGTAIGKWLSGICKVYPVENGKGNKDKPLLRGKDFNLYYKYIYYCSDSGNIVKFKGNKYQVDDFASIRDDNGIDRFCIKDYSWEYEKEFRVLIELKENKENFEKLSIPIDDIKNFKIMFAPEIHKNGDVQPEILDGFKKYINLQFENSTLGVSMGLVGRNYNDFIHYVKTNENVETDKLCEVIKEKEKCINQKRKDEKQNET